MTSSPHPPGSGAPRPHTKRLLAFLGIVALILVVVFGYMLLVA